MSVIVPYQDVPQESLINLISAFVLREGTDYGDVEVSLEQKIQQVLDALKANEAHIVYSELEESFDIVSTDSLNIMSQKSSEQEPF